MCGVRGASHVCFPRFLVVLIILTCASSAIAGEPNAPRRGLAPPVGPIGADECLGVPNCVGRRSDVALVGGGQQTAITVECGGERPHAWHWEPLQHGHIQSSLQQCTPTGLTVLARNVASIAGTVAILVGCSSEPFDEVRAAAQRPLPAKVRYRNPLGWPPSGGSVCDAYGDDYYPQARAVPECIPVDQPLVEFGFFATHTLTNPCPDSHPFYAHTHYTFDNACFSCIDSTTDDPAFALTSLCTNWCDPPNRHIRVTSACSKIPFTFGCGAGTKLPSDPGCGRTHERTHCTDGATPVCITVWHEECFNSGLFQSVTCSADQSGVMCFGC